MWLGCACSRYRRHLCGSAVLAVGTGGMRVARLCCSRFRGICVDLLCLQ